MQEENQQAAGATDEVPQFTTQEWVVATPDTYDLTKEFEEQVLPILKTLEAKCSELGMPFVVRTVIAQNERGNASNMVSWLGGATRATPELLAINSLQQFGHEYIDTLLALMGACADKFGGADDLDAGLRALLGGEQ